MAKGFNLTTTDEGIVVYAKEKQKKDGGTYKTYCAKVSSKDRDGNWQSAFVNLAFKKGVTINNKAVIKIKSSFPVLNTYNGNTSVSWMVMDYEVLNSGEIPASIANGDGFMDLPDSLDEEVPFN